jgi:ribosomal-protein-alanine N-acetyltransferase
MSDLFDFSTFPALTTERLVLRDLLPSDAPDVFVFRGDYEVQKYNDDVLTSVSQVSDFIDAMRAGYYARQRIMWAITRRGEDQVIGLCGFNYWDRKHNRAAIGYDLARAYWGQGIGTEAVSAIVRFGFERMRLNRIEAEALVDNTASVRLLEKLGFQREGARREFTLEDDGAYHDGGIFGLLRRAYFGE